MRYDLILFLTVSSILGSGCAYDPPYKFSPNEEVAKAKLIGLEDISLCKDSQYYSVSNEKNSEFANIPAGQRVTIGKFFHFSEHTGIVITNASCYAAMSFVPLADETYYVNTFIVNNRCEIEVVKHAPSTLNGIARVDSVGPVNCYQKEEPNPEEEF